VRVPTDLSRYADWTTWLAEQGATDPDVRVVWVGGSAATGGYDEWSDLDVDLLCTPGEADAVHDRLVARARATFAVDHVWELPTSTWPDGRQCFVNLQSRPGGPGGADPDHRPAHLRAVRPAPVRRRAAARHADRGALYLGFALSPLVRLLRVEHCPSVPTAGYQRR
jgi:hypothetical protein